VRFNAALEFFCNRSTVVVYMLFFTGSDLSREVEGADRGSCRLSATELCLSRHLWIFLRIADYRTPGFGALAGRALDTSRSCQQPLGGRLHVDRVPRHSHHLRCHEREAGHLEFAGTSP
jgi:hypothetical protein